MWLALQVLILASFLYPLGLPPVSLYLIRFEGIGDGTILTLSLGSIGTAKPNNDGWKRWNILKGQTFKGVEFATSKLGIYFSANLKRKSPVPTEVRPTTTG